MRLSRRVIWRLKFLRDVLCSGMEDEFEGVRLENKKRLKRQFATIA